MSRAITALIVAGWLSGAAVLHAADTPAQRGAKALQTRAFIPPFWSPGAWDKLWKHWDDGADKPPADYPRAIMDRYGLHTAPYPNGGFPMGMRTTTFLFKKGIASDCLLCHGGSINGKSYIGLGNAALDMQSLYEELNAAEGRGKKTPFNFCNARGTNEAGNMSVFLIAYRDAELNLHQPKVNLDQRDFLCEDVPAWWLLKKKKTMYYTGSTDSRSVRSLMQFMMHPLNTGPAIKQEEGTFRDILAYLVSLQPPKYPFALDADKAHRGELIFADKCARCHGTYGRKVSYPNRIVPIDVIGTDRSRFDGLSPKFGRHYNKSWFAQEEPGWLTNGFASEPARGYQAPPLDGIWATAPYFHNGSAPTVYHVLNSKARPRIFTRSYRTGQADYDPVKLGWKVQLLDRGPAPELPAIERRKVYDTTQPGRGNGGHIFGDKLSEEDRWAVIEYLKTL